MGSLSIRTRSAWGRCVQKSIAVTPAQLNSAVCMTTELHYEYRAQPESSRPMPVHARYSDRFAQRKREKDIFPDSSLAKRSDPVHLIVCAISLTCWREIIYHNSSTLLEVEGISQFDLLWINVSGLQFWGQPRNLDCKTLPCVSHKNINFIYALNDAVNVLKVLNMYGFLSSAEHKRRSLTECWRCSFAYNESEWWPTFQAQEMTKSTIKAP